MPTVLATVAYIVRRLDRTTEKSISATLPNSAAVACVSRVRSVAYTNDTSATRIKISH